MIESILRPSFDKFFVVPIARHKLLTQPNWITMWAVVFGMLIIPALFCHQALVALVLMLISGYFDILDGVVARENNNTTDLGSFLDILGDRIVEASIIIGLFLYAPKTRGLFCLLMLTSILLCITVFLLMGIFEKNNSYKSFFYDPGLMERAEAFLFFGLMIVFPQHFALLALMFSVLVLFTVGQHIRNFIR